jgi:hypothetical protein
MADCLRINMSKQEKPLNKQMSSNVERPPACPLPRLKRKERETQKSKCRRRKRTARKQSRRDYRRPWETAFFYLCRFSIEKKKRAKTRNFLETRLRENVIISENSNFKLKSNLQMPIFGHCSPNYGLNYIEYFHIFS